LVVGPKDIVQIVGHNLLVLALHAMACIAGFIAGSSLPLQARGLTGWSRLIHERGRPLALGFVVCATGFSLSMQAYALGIGLARGCVCAAYVQRLVVAWPATSCVA
jgi:hypothetical protein